MDSAAVIGFPVAEQYFSFDGHPTELYLRSDPSQVTALASPRPSAAHGVTAALRASQAAGSRVPARR
jgi:hypothetical protein